MYKSLPSGIKQYYLDPALHTFHKEGVAENDFGLDNSRELIEGGFGLYSSANIKRRLGPIKSQYFRISLVRRGTVTIDIGLESFHPVRDSIVFGFPGQLFSLYDPSEDFFCYYMLFTEEFITRVLPVDQLRRIPFFTYSGMQSFPLLEKEASGIEEIVLKMNDEIHTRNSEMIQALQLYLRLVLVLGQRGYPSPSASNHTEGDSGSVLFNGFIKLVGEHLRRRYKVSDYARLLHVSPDHLTRTIRSHSGKTARELIEDMIAIEAKAHLLHSSLSISEIAYDLQFADPSHFNKFFRKIAQCTPMEYRERRTIGESNG